jgi:hypothetical protein
MPCKPFKRLLALLALSAVSACRTDTPPVQELCALNGLGAGDCVEPGGATIIKPPSEMVNYICRSPAYEQAYDAFCFDTSQAQVRPTLVMIYQEAQRGNGP